MRWFLESLLVIAVLCQLLAPVLSHFGKDQLVIRVPIDYPAIQQAVDASVPGGTVVVFEGTYCEHLVVDKSLQLIGEGEHDTVLDGNGSGNAIVITADNVLVDGFSIRNATSGICVRNASNCTINGNLVTEHGYCGIVLENSNGTSVTNNLLTQCGTFIPGPMIYGGGIELLNSSQNSVSSNTIVLASNVIVDLSLDNSSNNVIQNNTMTDTARLSQSHWNRIHHNNFVNNTHEVDIQESFFNEWSNMGRGNYWSSYTGLDDGSNGRTANDGVGDTDLPHVGVDDYPLIVPYGPIPVVWENEPFPVTITGNSTISSPSFSQAEKKIAFNVNGPNTSSVCNVTIPKTLLSGNPWTILLNGTDITPQSTITETETHTSIHFASNTTITTQNVQIIGTWVILEYPAPALVMLALTIALFTVFCRKKRSNRSKQSQQKG
jgi:parallel beta-helix repeat protein